MCYDDSGGEVNGSFIRSASRVYRQHHSPQASGGSFELKEATLYTAFRRLEAANLIRSRWGDEQSGARRRYYSLTDEGKEKLKADVETWENTRALIDLLLKEEYV